MSSGATTSVAKTLPYDWSVWMDSIFSLARLRAIVSLMASFTPVYSLIGGAKFADVCAQGGYICRGRIFMASASGCLRMGPSKPSLFTRQIQTGFRLGGPDLSSRPQLCLEFFHVFEYLPMRRTVKRETKNRNQ